MKKVFLSYSREDEKLVTSLQTALGPGQLGCEVWLDSRLGGGQPWWDEILKEIRACDLFVLAVTMHSVNSAACMRECTYARSVGKPLLPVLLSEVSTNLLPQSVSDVQLVDYREDDRDAVASLARALLQIGAARALPDPLPDPPPVPFSYLEGLARRVRQERLSDVEQGSLVLDLKAALLDSKSAADARILLDQLRSRRDLFARFAREIDEALASDHGSSTPEAATSANGDLARAPASTKRRSFESTVQWVVMGGFIATFATIAAHSVLFAPRIEVQATDVDWEPPNPQVGQRVMVTGKYAISYRIRKGLRWSRDEVRGVTLNDIFTATWSVDGRDTNLENPRSVTTGDVVDATFETTFDRPGPHEIAFSVRSNKSDAEAGKKKVVRTVYVQTAR